MRTERIKAAEKAAAHFTDAMKAWKAAQGTWDWQGETYPNHTPKQNGALRRASMDLTRALAEMRKP